MGMYLGNTYTKDVNSPAQQFFVLASFIAREEADKIAAA